MVIWQVDFYRRPLKDETGQTLWELLVCNQAGQPLVCTFCPQGEATADWLVAQLAQLERPDRIQVFRPQTFNLLEAACQNLGIAVEPTRRTPALKEWVVRRSQEYATLPGFTNQPYQPLQLDQPPPLPLPENLWGDQWRFATLTAGMLVEAFQNRPIPIQEMPEDLLPLKLGLPSDLPLSGVVIDGGRQSMRLARWLAEAGPVNLSFVVGAPDGLVLETGLIDRWIVATSEDPDVKAAAGLYEQRKAAAKGLHFMVVQPDDSGMTYTGVWLLRSL